jgi:hypothetical protein
MGVDDFWPVLFPNFKKKTPIKLSSLKGRSVGFDLSVWLHHFCAIDEVVKYLSCSPQYRPPALTKAFDRRVATITKHGINPIFVLDGRDHPMKGVARAKRRIQNCRKPLMKEKLSSI